MKVLKDFKNKLLKRREIEIFLSDSSNPGFEKVKKEVSKHFGATDENVVVKNIKSSFGDNEFTIDVFIYDNIQEKELIEPKKKEKKKVGG